MSIDLQVNLSRLNDVAPYGDRLMTMNQLVSVEYVRTLNQVGTLKLVHPADVDVIQDFNGVDMWELMSKPDTMVEAWLQVDATRLLDGDTFWFGRRPQFKVNANGPSQIVWEGFDNKHLLQRRITPYPADTDEFPVPHSSKEMALDDMMKEIVDENYGAAAIDPSNVNYQFGVPDPTRDVSSILAIEPMTSLAPVKRKEFSHRRILSVLQDICDDSDELGVPLFFDIKATYASPFLEFRTYVDQPGADYSINSPTPMYFGTRKGNMAEMTLDHDARSEYNVIYTKGNGRGVNRAEYVATDPVRMATSPLNRHELFWDSRNTRDVLKLQTDAEARLHQGRPKRVMRGRILQQEWLRYGRDYFLGDRVVGDTQYGLYDCLVDKVKVRLDGEKSLQIDAYLSGELIEE